MERRTFLQVSLLGLAGGVAYRVGAAPAADTATVLEQLRHHGAQDDWPPFVLGLGRRGRQLAIDLDSVVDREHPALIYAESDGSTVSGHQAAGRLLDDRCAGVLLCALNEPDCWPRAMAWATMLRDRDVYLKAAIICADEVSDAERHPFIRRLASLLDVLIIQPDTDRLVDPPGFHPALQSARTFLMEPQPVCLDISDIRRLFAAGKIALAASSRVMPLDAGGNPAAGFDACLAEFENRRPRAALLRWCDGPNLSMRDFDLLARRLEETLDDDAIGAVMLGMEPGLPDHSPALLQAIWVL